jgi:hypothetical protein
MAAVTTYTAMVTREDGWWLITVDGVGVTQARRFDEIPRMAKGLVQAMDAVDPSAFAVEIEVQGMGHYFGELDAAVHRAETAQREVASLRRAMAKRAVDDMGLSLREAASVLGLSHQRVAQLLDEGRDLRV